MFLQWLVQKFEIEKRGPGGYVCMKCGVAPSIAASSSSSSSPPSSSSSSNSPFHVVDVAGGRGQLAFYLSSFYSIPVSVVDPVSMNLRRYELLYEKKQEAALRRKREGASSSSSGAEAEALPQVAAALAGVNVCSLCERPTSLLSSPSSSPLPSDSPPLPSRPVSWLPHLRHYPCLFPSSIGLSLSKKYGE